MRLRPETFPLAVPVMVMFPAPPLVERLRVADVVTLPVKVMSFPFVVIPPPSVIPVVPVSATAPVAATDWL